MTQYRLLVRAEMRGAIREPGFIFELAPGELGPHRTVVASDHGAQITDHMNMESNLVDMPLYEEVKEPVTPEPAPEAKLSPEQAADQAKIADLERELADKDRQLGEAHAKLAAIGDTVKA